MVGEGVNRETEFQRKEYDAGDVLWRVGDPSDFVCLIVSGTIALYRVNSSGREGLIGNFGPNELVGENALYGDEARSTTARALDDLEVIVTDGEGIRNRIAQFDTVSGIIIDNLLFKLKMEISSLNREIETSEAAREEAAEEHERVSSRWQNLDNDLRDGPSVSQAQPEGGHAEAVGPGVQERQPGQIGVGTSHTEPGETVDWDDDDDPLRRRKSGGIVNVLFGILIVAVFGLAVVYLMAEALPDKVKRSIAENIPWLEKEWRPDTTVQVTPLNKKKAAESRVAAKHAVIREWPSNEARQVGSIEEGDMREVIGKTISNGLSWYQIIRFGGKKGFVTQDAVKMF